MFDQTSFFKGFFWTNGALKSRNSSRTRLQAGQTCRGPTNRGPTYRGPTSLARPDPAVGSPGRGTKPSHNEGARPELELTGMHSQEELAAPPPASFFSWGDDRSGGIAGKAEKSPGGRCSITGRCSSPGLRADQDGAAPQDCAARPLHRPGTAPSSPPFPPPLHLH